MRVPTSMPLLTGHRRVRRRHEMDNPDAHGITALQGAACSGDIELVQILLDACADVNPPPGAGPFGGRTALQIAAGHDIELVQLLLSVGANVNAPAASNRLTGRTALQAAAEVGNIESVQMLLEVGWISTLLAIPYSHWHLHQSPASGSCRFC